MFQKAYRAIVKQNNRNNLIVLMKQNWVPVKEYVKSRKKDITITMEVSDRDYERYRQQLPSVRKTVKCRMVKVLAENGEEQILCTSLKITDSTGIEFTDRTETWSFFPPAVQKMASVFRA